MKDLVEQYRAARTGIVIADLSDRGRLFVSGRDALDLLHRLTTQDIRRLGPGQGAAAAFLTPKGRLIDWVTLHRAGDDVLCLTGAGRADDVAAHIDRYTFREQVTVRNARDSHRMLGLFGAAALEGAGRLFGRDPALGDRHHLAEVRTAGTTVLVVRTFPLAGEGYLLVVPAADAAAVATHVRAAAPAAEAGEECLEVLRIEAGIPAAGHEITEEFNPWEARLADSISLAKGCYVGQEVVARLDTYKKVSKVLVRLDLEAPVAVPPRASLERGAGEAVGTLTSAAAVPGTERGVGLGYVRDEDAAADVDFAVIRGDLRVRAASLGPAR